MQNRDFIFEFDERPSDSPYVDVVWRTNSEGIGGEFISIGETRWGMVITRENGNTTITIMGAETQASIAPIPKNADFMGVVFKHGVLMPHLTPLQLVDNHVQLPSATGTSFWLGSASWQIPTFDNVDVFVNRLVREGILGRDPLVQAVLNGDIPKLSARSVQRRFLRATGISYGTLYQIERAKEAMDALVRGESILDTVEKLGYADQPHLTRSLKRFMGQTPAQLSRLLIPE